MVEHVQIRETAVQDLLESFRSALVAVVPSADRSHINWRDLNRGDDWERLAECMFDVFVRDQIQSDVAWAESGLPLPKFDFDISNYSAFSWISVTANASPPLALVRLLSLNEPFDTVQAVEVDPGSLDAGERRKFPWKDVGFTLARRESTGYISFVTDLRLLD